MGYDIYVKNRKTNETIQLKSKHGIHGGTYCIEGTEEAWLKITYNYAKWFYQLWPAPTEKDTRPFFEMFNGHEGGIRRLYGLPLDTVIAELERGVDTLKGDPDPDYWKATEGNARVALFKLKLLCEMARYENPDEDLTIEGD